MDSDSLECAAEGPSGRLAMNSPRREIVDLFSTFLAKYNFRVFVRPSYSFIVKSSLISIETLFFVYFFEIRRFSLVSVALFVEKNDLVILIGGHHDSLS
jgi:hypothetical protein